MLQRLAFKGALMRGAAIAGTKYAPTSIVVRHLAITAAQVKQLRESSGAPMMDCKKALGENDGDMDAAMDWLRAKGIAKAAANADRVAQEGLVAVLSSAHGMTLVEVNSETDFVGKNEDFHSFVDLVARTASQVPTEGLCGKCINTQLPNGASMTNIAPETFLQANDNAMQNALGLVVATIRENIVIKRIVNILPGSDNVFGHYVHGKVNATDGDLSMGKAAAVVCLHATGASAAAEAVAEHGRKLAMHVVAAKPQFCREADVADEFLSRERAIMDEQMASDPKNSGKPTDVLQKIREGKLRKRLSEVCLASQQHMVADGAPVVSKFLLGAGKELQLGSALEVTHFQRWGLGEN